MLDLAIAVVKFNLIRSPADFLRELVNLGKRIQNHTVEFDKIYAKIKTHYVNESIEKERKLKVRRE